jgi:hypothetical protein
MQGKTTIKKVIKQTGKYKLETVWKETHNSIQETVVLNKLLI